MDVSTLISSEQLNNRRDNSSNGTTTFENRDITQVNVGRRRDLFCSYSFNESQRNSQDDTDCLERLYHATDIVLIICAVVIIVSILISLGIFIFGWSFILGPEFWKNRSLDNFVISS